MLKPPGQQTPLELVDLFADLDEVVGRLIAQLVSGSVLDAYLLAAGATQIIEDYLQPDPLGLSRAAEYLRTRDRALVPRSLHTMARGWETVADGFASRRRAARWQREAAELRDRLAAAVLGTAEWRSGHPTEAFVASGRRLLNWLPELSRHARREELRVPSCFRSFDLRPEDMRLLADRYGVRHPDRRREVLLIGVRTSGCYLAPLVGAALREAGFTDITVATARPHRRLRAGLRRSIEHVGAVGGRIVIVDDPPASGRTVDALARQLVDRGAPARSISILLPLFGADLPPALRDYDAVVLPFDEWFVHQLLAPESVRRRLSVLLGEPVRGIHPTARPSGPPRRTHLRRCYEVELSCGERRAVLVAGSGIGYLGGHARAVAGALSAYLPRTYGFHDGVFFRDWLPDEQRVGTFAPSDVPALTAYLNTRAEVLTVRADHSVRLAGQQPVWEAAALVLQRGYGRLGVLLRPVFLDRAVKALCRVPTPAVVDGATARENWFRTPEGLRKIDAHTRAFANTDLACFDPAYDLAGIDPGGADSEFLRTLRAAIRCDDERFLLYELVQLWDRARRGADVRRPCERAVQRYVAHQLLADVDAACGGPLCALDVDGVLESTALGFSILTPTAARCVRALRSHGLRPVPVTGRSAAEVRERCTAYGLAGGVAEYGAMVYQAETGAEHNLVPERERAVLAALRDIAAREPDIHVDGDYHNIVRAYRSDSPGQRRALSPATESRLITAVASESDRVRVIRGVQQTDFVPAGVDKGRGLLELTKLLGIPADQDGVALAVGDSAPDLPMLTVAGLGFAPGNAAPDLRASGVPVLHACYAAGLARATSRLLGHRPGRCPTCRGPALPPRSRTLLSVLDAQAAGRAGLPAAAFRGLLRSVVAAP